MKRILIVNNNMHIGGVQKALLNLLHEIHGQYEVTLLLFYGGGALRKDIPEDVSVVELNGPLRYWGMTKYDASNGKERLARGAWAAASRIFGRNRTMRAACIGQKQTEHYDAAISFLHSGPRKSFYGGCNEFVLRCVNAERKITFLHCDYEKIGAACSYNQRIYRQFDRIAACSQGCAEAFLRVMPQLKEKTMVVPNCQNYLEIARLADMEPNPLPKDRLNILTVARLGKEKGVLRAIRAIASLESGRKRLRYDIIGTGVEHVQAEALISKLGLTDTVCLLGEKENPYGYMRAADVLLIPSVSEAAPMVIGEAACLGTPVLTTNTSSAGEMVADTKYGWVCDNSEDGIKEGIQMLLSDPEEVQSRKQYLESLKFDNSCACTRFAELMN